MITLQNTLGLYIPSTQGQKPISPADHIARADHVSGLLAGHFGGFTQVSHCIGGWLSYDNQNAEAPELIREPIILAYAHCDIEAYNDHFIDVLRLAQQSIISWAQESIGILDNWQLLLLFAGDSIEEIIEARSRPASGPGLAGQNSSQEPRKAQKPAQEPQTGLDGLPGAQEQAQEPSQPAGASVDLVDRILANYGLIADQNTGRLIRVLPEAQPADHLLASKPR